MTPTQQIDKACALFRQNYSCQWHRDERHEVGLDELRALLAVMSPDTRELYFTEMGKIIAEVERQPRGSVDVPAPPAEPAAKSARPARSSKNQRALEKQQKELEKLKRNDAECDQRRKVDALNGHVDHEQAEKAFAAVREFNQRLPQYQSTARLLSGNPNLIVKPSGTGSRTDGNIMYLRVPTELGVKVKHDILVCGRRGENGASLCPACFKNDDTQSVLYHELSHICFGSFEELDPKIVRPWVARFPELLTTPRLAKLDRLDAAVSKTCIGAANTISAHLGVLLNGVEDARVNGAQYKVRGGLRVMGTYRFVSTMEKGVPHPDGTRHLWKTYPEDAQLSIVALAAGSGFPVTTDWFSQRVVDFANDPAVKLEMDRIGRLRSSTGALQTAVTLYGLAKRAGFFAEDDDKEPEPEEDEEKAGEPGDGDPQENSDEQDDDDGNGASADDDDDDELENSGSGDLENDDDASADGDDESAEEGSETEDEGDDADDESDGAGDESDDADDEGDGAGDGSDSDGDDDVQQPESGAEAGAAGEAGEHSDPVENARLLAIAGDHGSEQDEMSDPDQERAIEIAILQENDFEAASRNVACVRKHYIDKHVVVNGVDLTQAMSFSGEDRARFGDWTPGAAMLGKALQEMRIVFAANKATKRETGKRVGRVHGPHLYRVAAGDDRVFTISNRPGKRDWEVLIGIDTSGSTGSGRYSSDGPSITTMKKSAMAMAEMLDRVGIPFRMYAHTGAKFMPEGRGGLYPSVGYRGETAAVDIFVIREKGETWGEPQRERLRGLSSAQCNLDGHTLEFYRKVMDTSKATDRMILYYTDGAMPAENKDEETVILRREIKTCRDHGIRLVGVAFQCDDPIKYGLDTIRFDKAEDVPMIVQELKKRILS